jgi:hypothetical protein
MSDFPNCSIKASSPDELVAMIVFYSIVQTLPHHTFMNHKALCFPVNKMEDIYNE